MPKKASYGGLLNGLIGTFRKKKEKEVEKEARKKTKKHEMLKRRRGGVKRQLKELDELEKKKR